MNDNGVPRTLIRGTSLRDLTKAVEMWINLDYFFDIKERSDDE